MLIPKPNHIFHEKKHLFCVGIVFKSFDEFFQKGGKFCLPEDRIAPQNAASICYGYFKAKHLIEIANHEVGLQVILHYTNHAVAEFILYCSTCRNIFINIYYVMDNKFSSQSWQFISCLSKQREQMNKSLFQFSLSQQFIG